MKFTPKSEQEIKLTKLKGSPKDDGGYYPDKNAVKDYMTDPIAAKSVTTSKLTSNTFIDDDIPF